MEFLRLLIRLPQLIKLATEFAQGARDLTQTDGLIPAGATEEEVEWLRSGTRSMIRTCIFVVVVFGVALPLTVPWVGWLADHISSAEAVERMLCGMIFMMFLIPVSMFLAASIACLFAPTQFLESPFGGKWMRFVGTKSIIGTRIVSFLVALALTAFFAGYSWFILAMHSNHRPA